MTNPHLHIKTENPTPKERALADYLRHNGQGEGKTVAEIFNLAYEYSDKDARAFGYEQGHKDGYKQGHKDGYTHGHKDGYNGARDDLGITDNSVVVDIPQEYRSLFNVLFDAYGQAANGKGKERHANDLPFEQQRMLSISRLIGSADGLVYQACKKITEAMGMGDFSRQRAELLGAINYTAGIVVWLGEQPVPPATDYATGGLCNGKSDGLFGEQPGETLLRRGETAVAGQTGEQKPDPSSERDYAVALKITHGLSKEGRRALAEYLLDMPDKMTRTQHVHV